MAWFFAHAQIAGRLAPPLLEPPEIRGPLPTRERMMADLFRLLRRDRANIEAGHYRPPRSDRATPLPALGRSLRFFADLGAIDRRRRAADRGRPGEAGDGDAARYPDYYLRNFHYQTDGYLSEHSAALYDFQVEVLFNGGADVDAPPGPGADRRAPARPPDPRPAPARRRLRHRALPRHGQAQLAAPAGHRRRPQRALSAPRRARARRAGRGSSWSRARPRRCRSPTGASAW